MRKGVTVLLVSGLMVMSTIAYADSYFLQGSVTTETMKGDFLDSDRLDVDATFYFKPVNQLIGPLAEAAFLSRSTFANVTWSNNENDVPFVGFVALPFSFDVDVGATLMDTPFNIFGVPGDGVTSTSPVSFAPPVSTSEDDDVSIAMRYVTPSGYIAQASFTTGEGSSDFGALLVRSESDLDRHSLAFQFGQYITPHTTVMVGTERSENEQNTRSNFGVFGADITDRLSSVRLTQDDLSVQRWSVSARHLMFADNSTHAISARVAYETNDSTFSTVLLGDSDSEVSAVDKSYATTLGAAYTYYPFDALGIGAELNRIDAEFSETTQLGVRAEWFVRPNVALELAYLRSEVDLDFVDPDIDGWSIGITGRY